MAAHPRGKGDNRGGRHDKAQPIIIQNMEFLSPGQQLFKKKPLSTANLFLSHASLSRQTTPTVTSREQIKARPSDSRDLDPERESRRMLSTLAKEGQFWKPPADAAVQNQKRVTFSDSVAQQSSANTPKGDLHSKTATNDSSFRDFNNNGDRDKNERAPVSLNINGLNRDGKVSSEYSAATGSAAEERRRSHITEVSKLQQTKPLHDVSGTVKHADQTLEAGNSRADTGAIDDHSSTDTPPVKSASGPPGQHSSQQPSCLSRDSTFRDSFLDVSAEPAKTDSTGADGQEKSPSDVGTKPTGKTKRVSFKLSDDEDTDRASTVVHTDGGPEMWYDIERHQNSPRDERGYYHADETRPKRTYPKAYQQSNGAVHQTKIPPVPKRSGFAPKDKVGYQRTGKMNNTLGTLSEANIKLGTKIVRLNFLKDETPRRRDNSRDDNDRLNSRHSDSHHNHSHRLSDSRNLDRNRGSEVHFLNKQYMSPSFDAGSSSDLRLNLDSDVFITNPSASDVTSERTVKSVSSAFSSPPHRTKSHGEINTDYLMQMYSATGTRTTASSNQEPDMAQPSTEATSTATADGKRPEEQTIDDAPGASFANSSKEKRPSTVNSSASHYSRAAEKERLLLSPDPALASRRLSAERRAVRSSSASSRGSFGRRDGRSSRDESESMIDRLLLHGERSGVAERTVRNRRLEELVVASTQCSRQRLVLERSRSNLM